MLPNLDVKYKKLLSFLMVIAGNCVYALAVKLFVLPANLISCGTTGIALVVNRLTDIPISEFIFVFNILMLALGWWVLGKQFEQYITPVDHWIAFVLLGYIGGKMIWDAFHEDGEDCGCQQENRLDLKELLMMAIATSIDALAVGITFAFLQVHIVPAVSSIALITFGLSFVGVIVGNKFGNRFQNKAQLAGGAVLIIIGVKILLEHLGVIA